LNFKWPYHAKVMNTLEQVSSAMGAIRSREVGIGKCR